MPATVTEETPAETTTETAAEPVPPAETDTPEAVTAAAEVAEPEAPPATDPEGRPYRRWRSIAVFEGVWTGDYRMISPEALTWRDLPRPLMAKTATTGGHDGAEVVGRIDSAERVDASAMVDARTGEPHGEGVYAVRCEGVFLNDEQALRIAELIEGRFLRGVSVDLTDVDYQDDLYGPDGTLIEDIDAAGEEALMHATLRETVLSGRISELTITPSEAFEGAFIELVDEEGNAGPATAPGRPDREQAVAALNASVATYSPRACIPCQSAPLEGEVLPAAAPVLPLAAWFADPMADPDLAAEDWPYVPVTASGGRVFGQLALWETCHMGYLDRCVKPPRSAVDYALFRRKSIPTADGGPVKIGPLTVGTGHADTRPGTGMFAAMAHYDNTGHVVADVTVGENAAGIWVAGAVRPDATPEQVRVVQASSTSGDWRAWGAFGSLELAAILMVNTPGFPVVRQVVAGGAPQALVASFVPRQRRPSPVEEVEALLPELRAIGERDRVGRAGVARERMAAFGRAGRAAEARGRMGVS